MKRIVVITLFAAAALLATSCKDKGKEKAAPTPAAAARAQLAPGVTPGSYEDWCDIHHLPMSQDTQCNPDLIPAFKAAGDWCEEHNMPESQCTKCHPEIKIVRPPKQS